MACLLVGGLFEKSQRLFVVQFLGMAVAPKEVLFEASIRKYWFHGRLQSFPWFEGRFGVQVYWFKQ